jgi:acetyl-CoA carboxylase biotin carboxyl carrier protein
MHLPQAAANPAAPVAVSSAETKDSTEGNYITIKSPMVGTFYRKAGPDKPSYVNVGDEISVGETVCMIEAMKLFNEIESEVSGRIVKILVDDSKPVEFDQALFLVDPS